jgi:hypothetical protein
MVQRCVLLATAALVVWFYAWTVLTTICNVPRIHGAEPDYFNLLSHGFLDGHAYMKCEVPDGLIKAEDPYDPAKRPAGVGLHDASYFKGKYYLYFGAAPVVTVFVPFRLLTGCDLPMPYVNWGFVSLGFLASAALFLQVRRRYFPGSRAWLAVVGLLVLAACAMLFAVLRRPSIWELPIAAGYAFAMNGLFFAVHGHFSQRDRLTWWVLAGISFGLAVGRPVWPLSRCRWAGGCMASFARAGGFLLGIGGGRHLPWACHSARSWR